MDAIGIPVSSWMFQEISELCTFKVLRFLGMCLRECVPAEGVILFISKPKEFLPEMQRRRSVLIWTRFRNWTLLV